MKPFLEAVIDVYFILKSKQKKPFALSFNCAASALLPLVVWWGCEILDLPPSAPEALGLGEVGHTLSTLTAGLYVPDSKYTYCLRKVSKCGVLSLAQALLSSFPQVSLCSVIPGAYFNGYLLSGASVTDDSLAFQVPIRIYVTCGPSAELQCLQTGFVA